MKPKSTLILLLLTAGLFAFAYVYTTRTPSTRKAAEQDKYVTTLDVEDVTGITITRRGDSIVLNKEGDQWLLKEPVADRADKLRINAMLDQLAMIPKEETIIPTGTKDEIHKEMKRFSVRKPKMRIELSGKNVPPAILIGRDTAVENRIYLRLEDEPEVYVVSSAVRDTLNPTIDELRDHQVMNTPADGILHVLINTERGDIELEKSFDDWNLVRPISARADSQMVDHLVRSLTTTRIESFIDDDEAGLANHGLGSPRGTIKLYGDDESAAEILHLGNPVTETSSTSTPQTDFEPTTDTTPYSPPPVESEATADNTEASSAIYALYPPRDAVYTLPGELGKVLNHSPNDFRDKALLRLDLDMVDRFTLTRPDGTELLIVRELEDWILHDGDRTLSADAGQATEFLTMLRDTMVTEFVADTASNLEKYGLDSPIARIRISSYSSENVAHNSRGEHPLVTVLFGKIEGDQIFARLENEPFIISLDKSILAAITTDAVFWRNLDAVNFEPGTLNGFEVQTPNLSLGFIVDRDGVWRSDRGVILDDSPQFESFINTLSDLRAVRWVGTRSVDHGLDKPEMTIAYETQGQKHLLRIGTNAGADMWYASLDDQDAVFLISRPAYETLRLPLTLLDTDHAR